MLGTEDSRPRKTNGKPAQGILSLEQIPPSQQLTNVLNNGF